MPIFIEQYIRPLFCRGLGPFRWVAISGDPSDIEVIDDLVIEHFPENPLAASWISMAQKYVRHTGLPARISWLAHGERNRLAQLVNEAVHDGRLQGPVAFTWDHLDEGVSHNHFVRPKTCATGSDAVSDWPLLNALLTSVSRVVLFADHAGGGGYRGGTTHSGRRHRGPRRRGSARCCSTVLQRRRPRRTPGSASCATRTRGIPTPKKRSRNSDLEWISDPTGTPR